MYHIVDTICWVSDQRKRDEAYGGVSGWKGDAQGINSIHRWRSDKHNQSWESIYLSIPALLHCHLIIDFFDRKIYYYIIEMYHQLVKIYPRCIYIRKLRWRPGSIVIRIYHSISSVRIYHSTSLEYISSIEIYHFIIIVKMCTYSTMKTHLWLLSIRKDRQAHCNISHWSKCILIDLITNL